MNPAPRELRNCSVCWSIHPLQGVVRAWKRKHPTLLYHDEENEPGKVRNEKDSQGKDTQGKSLLVVDKRMNRPPEDEELRLGKGLKGSSGVQAGFCLSHSEGRELRELPHAGRETYPPSLTPGYH